MNNSLEQAKKMVSVVDRECGGVSIEEAASWLAKNWFALVSRNPKEAGKILDNFFDLFMQRFPDANDLSLQAILGFSIAAEENADPDAVIMWLTDSWAKRWRDYLVKNGIEIRGIQEDKNACRLTQSRLWTLINKYRREKDLVDLQHHYDHAKHAAKHSEEMARREEIFQSSQYFFQHDGFEAEDVIKILFEQPNGSKRASEEIFNEIVKKENLLEPKFTGVGIGLWMGREDIIYATIRYSKICCGVKKSFAEESA